MPGKHRRNRTILSLMIIAVVALIATSTTLLIHASAAASVAQRTHHRPPVTHTPATSTPGHTSPTATPTQAATPPRMPASTPTPIPPTPTPRPAPTQSTVGPHYVVSGNGQQATISTIITWYGYNDNSGDTEDQHGSAAIAYPKNDGYPTLHNHATEGTGTYSDPVTFAAPDKDLKSSFPIGSIIYVPLVKKYFIMEDQCGDDDPEGCQNGANHADLWMGPAQAVNGNKLDQCEGNATPNGAVSVIINPASTMEVDTTQMYTSGNACTVHLYN